jgi:hypothetical protein
MHALPGLPASVSREVFATICASLPPPATDAPEIRADREDTAMAAVAALHPADAFEALLAVRIVVAEANAVDSIALSMQYRNDLAATLRCRAQASAMMRQAQSALRSLRQMQAAREKAETEMQPAAMERAGYWYREAASPPPPAEPAPQPAGSTEPPHDADLHPDRAARIRAEGALPSRPNLAPPSPSPEIVAEIVGGTSPLLKALGQHLETTAA